VPLLRELRERGTPPDASMLAGRFDTVPQARQRCSLLSLFFFL